MNTIYQISLLQSLVNGYYDGVISVRELKKLGDTGIGTFDGADGEMIFLDNTMYKAKVDGNVEVVSDDELVPFSNCCKFIKDDSFISSSKTISDFKVGIKKYRDNNYKNMFIVIKASGVFKNMVVRSIPKQNKPYKQLDYIVDNAQKIYNYKNINGTLIGFLAPNYMKDLNTTDLHMHFISNDKLLGGHVLDLSFDALDIEVSVKNSFKLILSSDSEFNNMNLDTNNEIIKKVEE